MNKKNFTTFFCYIMMSIVLVGCAKEYAYPTGKDDILIFGDGRIRISKVASDTCLLMNSDSNISTTLLREVENFKLKQEILYVKSKEGYGVINKDYTIHLFITVPDEEFVSGYSEDKEGNRTYHSRYIEDDNISYLDSFSDFTEKEQEILTSL